VKETKETQTYQRVSKRYIVRKTKKETERMRRIKKKAKQK
jgi:hypothetical protein